jgi:ABC-type lipoprotein export system ATPase subunit|tara:strand:+ start:7798 stop:8019 length:222 start_codon:yes stop_codon:yes gene_type:complete
VEHPLIGNIDSLTNDELMEKITDLNNKYTICMRTGNHQVLGQLRMAMETYKNKLAEKTKRANPEDFEDKIDIS